MNDFLSVGIGKYRKFGIPYQFPVYNMREINEAVKEYNGMKNCFISISEYQQSGNQESVFPLYFPCDLDADENHQDNVNNDAAKIINWCYKNSISFLLHESGCKGLHVLIPLNTNIRHTTIHFKKFLQFLTKELNLKTIDAVCAETKRLIRIPNTMNMKSKRFCQELETYEANEMNINDFVDIKSKSFEHKFDSSRNLNGNGTVICKEPFYSYHPCIDSLICNDDVDHIVRWTWVKLRQLHGLNEKEIFDEARKMGWSDFDAALTAYQIRYTMNKSLKIKCRKEYCIDECVFKNFRKQNKNV